jgi:hypothetical protein
MQMADAGWQAIVEPVPAQEVYFTSVEIIEEGGMVRFIAFHDRATHHDGPVERVIVARGIMSLPCFMIMAQQMETVRRQQGRKAS